MKQEAILSTYTRRSPEKVLKIYNHHENVKKWTIRPVTKLFMQKVQFILKARLLYAHRK